MKPLKILALLLSAALMLSTAGCTGQADSPASPPPETPLTISFYGNLGETYLPFINKLAAQFPAYQIEYEYQWDTAFLQEPERRMLNGDGPDLCIISNKWVQSMSEQDLLLNLTNTPLPRGTSFR